MREYLQLLSIPGAKRLVLSSIPPRLAYGMSNLALFFHVQAITNSITVAGVAVGAYGGVSASTATIRGHAVDRWGQTRPLAVLVPAYAAAAFALALFASDRNTAIALSALLGLTSAPINLSVRPLWKELAGDELVRTAYALDTVVLNATSLLGPVVGTWAALQLSGATALFMTGGFMLLGGLLLLTTQVSRNWVPEPKAAGEPGILRSPAMRLLAFEGLLMGLGYGLLDIGIPSAATLAGVKEMAAVSLAAISLGGLIGGVVAGSQFKHWAPARGLVISQYCWAGLAIPLFVLQPGWPTAALLLLAGFPAGMSQVFYLEVIDLVRPRGTAVTAIASVWFIEGSAAALGNAIAGFLADSISPAAPLLACALFFLASAVTLHIASRGVLRPAMHLTGAEPTAESQPE